MTLHWWMHWFWVTAQFLVILGSPFPSSTSDPVNQQPQSSPRTTSPRSINTEDIYRSSKTTPRPNFRIAKAIGIYPQTNTAVVGDRQQPVTTVASSLLEHPRGSTDHEVVDESPTSFRGNISEVVPLGATTPTQRNVERIRTPTTKKDSKITWILTTSKSSSGRSKYDQEERYNQSSGGRNVSFDEVEDLTVLPLQEEMIRVDLSNRTRSSHVTSLSAAGVASNAAIRTFNRSDDEIEIDEEIAQTQHLATAASILEVGVSESTRLSRARNTFTQHFQRDQMQGDNQSSDYTNDSNTAEQQSSGTSAAGIAAITGSCLATVALLSTMGSLGFIIYRRKYLNPPQTLNSDKCSNPDSSGYIDDSTIRDNSEEMYSLDNDSFLNSLEAMTIQNYWTDSVKHTKL